MFHYEGQLHNNTNAQGKFPHAYYFFTPEYSIKMSYIHGILSDSLIENDDAECLTYNFNTSIEEKHYAEEKTQIYVAAYSKIYNNEYKNIFKFYSNNKLREDDKPSKMQIDDTYVTEYYYRNDKLTYIIFKMRENNLITHTYFYDVNGILEHIKYENILDELD
jgi:hypothetical protein